MTVIGAIGRIKGFAGKSMAISLLRVEVHGSGGYYHQAIIPLAVDTSGQRLSTADAILTHLREVEPALTGLFDSAARERLLNFTLPEMLRREVEHHGLLREGTSLAIRLIAWIETN